MTSPAEIRRSRRELAGTIARLQTRLKPLELAADVQASVSRTASDVVATMTGHGLPESAPRRRRVVAACTMTGVIALVTVIRLTRRHQD